MSTCLVRMEQLLFMLPVDMASLMSLNCSVSDDQQHSLSISKKNFLKIHSHFFFRFVLLVQANADINAMAQDKSTPLQIAQEQSNQEIVSLLLYHMEKQNLNRFNLVHKLKNFSIKKIFNKK